MINRLKTSAMVFLSLLLLVSSSLASNVVQLNPEYFPNPTIGRALSGAQIYVGVVDLDPEVVANQIQLSVLQENGTTVDVAQPLFTGAGGVPLYNGSPVTMLVDGSYSLKVLDSVGSQIYYIPKNAELESITSIVNIADLRAITTTPANGDIFTVLGYYAEGDGGGGQFYWDATSVLADNGGTIIKVTTIATGRWFRLYDGYNIKSIWFGTVGDDSASSATDTAALQSAIDNTPTGGTLGIGDGFIYSLKRTTTPIHSYGIKIDRSDITLTGRSIIKREDSIVSTGYVPVFVGVPDSVLLGERVENIVIDGIDFVGDDIRHTNNGDAASDLRYAIGTNNFRNLTIENCNFSNVDSGCIYSYGTYVLPTFYQLQKSYDLKILNNNFVGNEHAVQGRALIHAIATFGVDDTKVHKNDFKWIDDCYSPFGTFQSPDQTEDDTFTYLATQLKRAGKNSIVTKNTAFNTSEHFAYMIQPGFVITGNISYTDTPTICTGDIKTIRGYGTISANKIEGGYIGMSIMILARDVAITGNQIYVQSAEDDSLIHMGINIDAQDLTAAQISNQPFLEEDIQTNIVVGNNVITMPDVVGTLDPVIGIRVVTAASQTLTAPYSIDGVSIKNNTISNYKFGVYFVNTLSNNVEMDNNTFKARAFTTAGFSGATAMDTYAPFVVFHNSNIGDRHRFFGNTVFGAEYLFASEDGSGAGLNLPIDCSNNRLDYIQNIGTADMDAPAYFNNFKNNKGIYFLDRAWSGDMTENNLSIAGVGDISGRRSCLFYTGTGVRWYSDDVGGFIVLGP